MVTELHSSSTYNLVQDNIAAEEVSKHGDKGIRNLLAESESSSTSVTDESDLTVRKTWIRYKMPGDEVDNGRYNASRRYPGYGEGIVLRPSTHPAPHPPTQTMARTGPCPTMKYQLGCKNQSQEGSPHSQLGHRVQLQPWQEGPELSD